MSDFIRNKSGQYHKVGTAGRLSLYTAKDNIGTHWLVTRDEEVIYTDYYDRPSVKLLRQRESEWNLAHSRCGNEPQPYPAAVPEGTPTNWKRHENTAASFTGY